MGFHLLDSMAMNQTGLVLVTNIVGMYPYFLLVIRIINVYLINEQRANFGSIFDSIETTMFRELCCRFHIFGISFDDVENFTCRERG